ncbi:aminotransferase class III-fold pyridoxal phosphate-dependent enzyme [Anaerosporobacter faecicola]|uniref:aminotransferase class III-fold pyridoxal phosphate-dependent enzyme n=1 Tax=Anaerosporobacter faecicola TaxID=2718714 RepID=UPI0014398264
MWQFLFRIKKGHLACSVALKSIEVFENNNYIAKIKNIEEICNRELSGFTAPEIQEIRIMGGCTCIEVTESKYIVGYQEYAYQRGVFARPFIKYIYAMVPYIITEEELVKVLSTMKEWFITKAWEEVN